MKMHINKIKYAPWLASTFLSVFVATTYIQLPENWILFASLPIGLYIALLLPFSWRHKKEWLSWIAGFLPLMFVGQQHNLLGMQLTLLSLSIASLVWFCFREGFISYIKKGA